MKNPYILKTTHDTADKHYQIALSEQVTFLNKAQILRELNKVPDGAELYIDASKTVFIEHDVLEIIADFKENAKYRNIDIKISPLNHLDLNGFTQSLEQLVVGTDEVQQISTAKQLKVITSIDK